MQAKFRDMNKERKQPVEHMQAKFVEVEAVVTRLAGILAAQRQPDTCS